MQCLTDVKGGERVKPAGGFVKDEQACVRTVRRRNAPSLACSASVSEQGSVFWPSLLEAQCRNVRTGIQKQLGRNGDAPALTARNAADMASADAGVAHVAQAQFRHDVGNLESGNAGPRAGGRVAFPGAARGTGQ